MDFTAPAPQPRHSSLLLRIQDHLSDSQVTYSEHLRFAVKASALLAYASAASMIHAFVPAFFPATSARIVIKLYMARLAEHPNPKYQEMIRAAARAKGSNGASAG